jgi:hypothetical protein
VKARVNKTCGRFLASDTTHLSAVRADALRAAIWTRWTGAQGQVQISAVLPEHEPREPDRSDLPCTAY